MMESQRKKEHEYPKSGKVTLWQIFSTLQYKEQYGNLAVHVFILIPVATFFAYLGMRLDRQWGFEPLLGMPYNIIVASILFVMSGFIVWYSYGYLFIMGGGSAGSHMGHTKKFVDTDIYSWIRHPSVVGKLIGVIALGILMRTSAFLIFIVPILLVYSIITNILIQERFCIKKFGDDYIRYKKEVPMLIPKISRIRRYFSERKRAE